MIIAGNASTTSIHTLHHCRILLSLAVAMTNASLYAQTSSPEESNASSREINKILNDAEQQETESQKRRSRIPEAERKAEASLTELGVKITRNPDGEVVLVTFPENSRVNEADFRVCKSSPGAKLDRY
jgi:hypothetical protein